MTKRLFVAIDLPEALQGRLAERQAALRPWVPHARWARPEGLHLTLKFLGEVATERIEATAEALAMVAARHARFSLRVTGLGAFPRWNATRVLWAGLAESPPLLAIQQEVETALLATGFPAEEKPFRPHVTLARLNPPQRLALPDDCLGPVTDPAFEAREILLYESRLGPGGPRYAIERRFPLLA